MSELQVQKRKDTEEPAPLFRLRNEIDKLFSEFATLPSLRSRMFDAPNFGNWAIDTVGVPHKADFAERDDAYEISMEVPGFNDKDIEVYLNDSTVTVKGETEKKKEEKKKDYYFSERSSGSFTRRFRLPEGVDQDKVSATLAKGVLTVELPKSKEAKKKEKKVSVKTAA